MLLPALNLKLSVASSAAIIANYLLQPQATCRLVSSNQTLLFSRQGCEVHQKQHFNSVNVPSCHCIWVNVMALCYTRRGNIQVLVSFCQIACLAPFSVMLSYILCVSLWEQKSAVRLHKEWILHGISLIIQALDQFWEEACQCGSWEVKAGVRWHQPMSK